MIKNGLMASILLAGTITIAGCNYLMPPKHQPTSRLPSRQQVCSQLRHQIIFNNNPTGPNMIQSTPIETARVSSQYERYNCDQLDSSSTANE